MKKIVSLLLIFILLSQSLPAYASNEFGLSILEDEEYDVIATQQDFTQEEDFPAQPDAVSSQELMRYSAKFWREAVRAIDGEEPLQNDIPPAITSLRPSFALPLYGTSVSVTGRKTFGIKGESRKYKNDNSSSAFKKSYSNYTFEQEMQIKMRGKIVDRIFVDIDYDDQSEDMQDISVLYKGKEGEFVQSAEFGDIVLSLPKTEFISFEKQLFGAQMHLQYGNANLRLIGSKTKGTSKNKQFTGSSVFETISLRDTEYVRRMYYNITRMLDTTDPDYNFFTYQMARNTEVIYINDGTTSSQYRFETLRYGDFAVLSNSPSSINVHESKFRQLERGVDYTIDYSRNMVIFNRTLKESDEVVMDYINSNGQTLSLMALPSGESRVYKLLKVESDRPESGGRASTETEIKTIYNLSRQQITRDDGTGNFTLVLQDANGNSVGRQEKCLTNIALSCPQVYSDTVDVDFEKGIFELLYKLNDASLYNNTPVSTRNLSFRVELNSKVKSYFVEADMVVQSEEVKVNGAKLKRNEDYYIDYSSGFLTFYREGIITQDAVIDVTYDANGGSSSDLTLLGARFDYDFTEKIGFGGTFLQEGMDAPNSAPNIGALSEKLTVYEVDAKAKDLNITEDLKVSVSGEAAKSVRDLNLFGHALVDNFEDAKQLTSASLIFREWQIASTPNFEYLLDADPNKNKNAFWGSVFWDTQMVKSIEINPNSTSSGSDEQQVLVINYDFSESDEVSIVYPLSQSGTDLSEKKIFELTALGQAGGPQINVHFGSINELSDSSNGDNSITCSAYFDNYLAYMPKTEDIYCRGTVSQEEDRGWSFENPDGTTARYNPFANNAYNRESQPNGRIDTQDLDGNGRLDFGDSTLGGSFGYTTVNTNMINGLPSNTLNNTTWQTFNTPVDLVDKDKWTTIKHIRISLKKPLSGATKGQIKIANVGMSGNSWTPAQDDDIIAAVNKIDNTDYVPIFDDYTGAGRTVFNYLYGSVDELRSDTRNKNIFEQALSFYYDTTGTKSEISANKNFSKMDFSTHKKLKFLVFVKQADANNNFFVRLGTDTNYHQINVPLDMSANQWNLIELNMKDTNDDGIPDKLQPTTPGITVTEVYDSVNPANVNYSQISKIVAGVSLITGTAGGSGEVWFNELHMSDSVSLEAYAYRGDAKLELDGWGEVGASYTKKEENFQTPVSVATGQDRENQDYYLKFNKIDFLPVSATYQKSSVETPRVLDTLNTNTVRSLDQGLVEKDGGNIRVDFKKTNLPQVGLEYTFENTDYHVAERKDEKETYSASVNQKFASGKFLREYTMGYAVSQTKINYSENVNNDPNDPLYNTTENSNRINTRLSLEPWKGSSITPTYSLTTIKEDRSGGASTALSYPKAMQQQAGVTANFRITRWLIPALSYNVTTQETNNLTTTTLQLNGAQAETFGIGELKSVNRSADGGISLTLAVKEIFPKAKFFGGLTLSNSYKLQDADSYVNVEDGLNTNSSLWLRSDLKPKNPYAYNRNMTLRDTITSTQRWYPFREYGWGGKIAPLGTLSIINNFTQTFQDSESTGTPTKTNSTTLPDTVLTLGEIEKFFGTNYWLTKTSIKLRYTQIENETVDVETSEENSYGAEFRFMLFNIFDNSVIYSNRNYDRNSITTNELLETQYYDEITAQSSFYLKRLRLTPKIVYAKAETQQRNSTVTEQYTDLSPSLNIRMDFSKPGGIWLPFVKRNYTTTNRIIWNTNLIYQQRRSDVTTLENKNYYEFNTSFDYEFSKNLRLTLSGAVQYMDHLYVESESYVGYNFATTITLQF